MKVDPYFSPGLHLGYTFGEGFFFGPQATVGLILENSPFPGFPGVTLGFRSSSKHDMFFADLQLSMGLFGGGAGFAELKDKSTGDVTFYTHVKAWGGFFGLLQYDYYFASHGRQHSLGVTGVAPIFTSYNLTM